MPNRLAGETSPYLLQHKDNPVDWYPWGEDAFARARSEDKPILLSVGYSACHWCHVMAHESFEDPAVAEVMNDSFVNVKVDREERPDVDAIYMDAVQQMTGRGGWPMTVFLTPDGRPFFGGTYYPPDDRHGMPSFTRVLDAVTDAYRTRRDELETQADRLAAAIAEQSATSALSDTGGVPSDAIASATENLEAAVDRQHGGFGGAPKFPQAMALDVALRGGADDVVLLTLRTMAWGGMYDQIGGGFHRYSTDARWLVPHFEKMLYDNALLSRLYAHAWQRFGEPLHRRIAEETLDYVLREMRSPAGGFYSSQDADSEGVEGKFFVWSFEEFRSLAPDLVEVFRVSPGGNFEGANILFRHDEADMPEQRRALFEARERRVKPGLDDKVLVAWSSLMAGSMAEAGTILGRDDLIRAAADAVEFVEAEMRREDGRLLRAWKDGRAGTIPAFCEDYANHADALVDVYEAGFDRRHLDLARRTYEEAERLFSDTEGLGWFATGSDAETLIVRPKEYVDNATPSACSTMTRVGLRLALHYGDDTLAARPRQWLGAMAARAARVPLGFGHLLGAAHFEVGPVVEIAFVGDEPTLRRVLAERYLPNRAVAGLEPSDDLPLLAGKTLVDGAAAAYVCENYACQRPVTTPDDLAHLLATPGHSPEEKVRPRN
jgi:uncharacterized protein YyaL (SSP411 family)